MNLTFDASIPYDFGLPFDAVAIPQSFADEYALRTSSKHGSALTTAQGDPALRLDWLNDTTAKLGTGPQPHLVTEAR